MTDEPRATREDPGPLLARTAEIATAYLRGLPERPVLVDHDVASLRAALVTALPEISAGELQVPSGPGWGVDLNEKVLAAHPWPAA